ncbi:hypothetical protein HHI36_017777 [Cryptolaemus montrouzieri]|uniref:Uncharacterized protein n=1 Tax=Cryptolaemus montrouzieri TaxID=559131 RepID=A0ABD2NPC5_9CUCU
MLRISSLEKKLATPDIYIADSSALNALDGAKFIPVPNINFGGRLVNELGKDLLKAASDGDVDEIRRLLSEGAPFTADWFLLNARTKVDRTPLHMAAYEGHLNIVELFLMDDCEVDCTDLLGMTPLHWAAQNGHANVVQALLKAGADKNIANKFGLKPVDIAHQIDRLDIVEMIEEEQQEDPTKAAENLTIEMAAEDENQSRFEIPEPTEEVVEDVGTPQELDEVIEEIESTPNEHIHLDNSLSDSIKFYKNMVLPCCQTMMTIIF